MLAVMIPVLLTPRRHRTSRRSWHTLVLAVLATACTSHGATSDQPLRTSDTDAKATGAGADGPAALALPVSTEPVRQGDLILRLSTVGQVRSDAVVRLRSEVNGQVAQVLVHPGQAVAQGQVLLRFEQYPFDLAVREAQVQIDDAEQRFRESFTPESMVTGKPPTAPVRTALQYKAGLPTARLRLERATYEASRVELRAPVAGVIDDIAVAIGEKVLTGQPLLTVVDTHHVRVEAQVLEHDLPLMHVGAAAAITSASAPGRVLHGRVAAVLPLVDTVSHAGRVVIRQTGMGTLRPGTSLDVELEATRLHNRRLVPSRAVIERDGRPLVFVVREGRAQWTYVMPGRTNGRETELLPDSVTGEIPVRPGEPVIVEGHLTLTHDAPVSVSAMPVGRAHRPTGPPRG